MTMHAGNSTEVRTSVDVTVPPDVAFDVFTREIDLWWRQGPRYRIAGKQRGQLNFEPGPGGRLWETFPAGSGTRSFRGSSCMKRPRESIWPSASRLQRPTHTPVFRPKLSTSNAA